MFVTTTNRVPGLRPAICRSWAMSIYNACGAYQWCTTTQEQTSTCTFLKKSSTKVRQSTRYTGTKTTTVTSTNQVNAWDTCTSVDDITLNEFARKILEVEVVDDALGNCSNPVIQPRVLYNPNTASPTTNATPLAAGVVALVVAFHAVLTF